MARTVLCGFFLLCMAGWALAEGVCAKCGEKVESPRWNFCPYCGVKLDQGGAAPGAPSPQAMPSLRDAYEPVSWDKIVFEKEKYHEKKVRFTARYLGMGQNFAPAESLGITRANYVNFTIQGNMTNYVDMKHTELVEKLKSLRPYTALVIFATIKFKKDIYGRGQDIYIVLVEDLDVQ